MFLEVEHNHCRSVLSALQYGFSSDNCDKLCLVSESGDKIFTNLSFISLFSKLICSISRESNQEDLPQLICVPLKVTTIENLMVLLSEGKLISENIESLKDVLQAAKIFDIEAQDWLIDIEEHSELVPPMSCPENENNNVEKSIFEPLDRHGLFSHLDWEDCELEKVKVEVKLEDLNYYVDHRNVEVES